jgi:hypothetical protein
MVSQGCDAAIASFSFLRISLLDVPAEIKTAAGMAIAEILLDNSPGMRKEELIGGQGQRMRARWRGLREPASG